jgi:hypothetical protein
VRAELIYIGGPGGTTMGEDYNTQQPVLPFPARYHVRWKTNNTFTSAKSFDDSQWQEANWVLTGDIYQSGTFVEMRIPRTDIGAPERVQIHMSMINEAAQLEGTFAGAPASSFSDGYDPDYTRYFEFDLGAAMPPSSYDPVP